MYKQIACTEFGVDGVLVDPVLGERIEWGIGYKIGNVYFGLSQETFENIDLVHDFTKGLSRSGFCCPQTNAGTDTSSLAPIYLNQVRRIEKGALTHQGLSEAEIEHRVFQDIQKQLTSSQAIERERQYFLDAAFAINLLESESEPESFPSVNPMHNRADLLFSWKCMGTTRSLLASHANTIQILGFSERIVELIIQTCIALCSDQVPSLGRLSHAIFSNLLLQHNGLTQLPNVLTRESEIIRKIQQINLSHNQINDWHSQCVFTALRYLDLSHNPQLFLEYSALRGKFPVLRFVNLMNTREGERDDAFSALFGVAADVSEGERTLMYGTSDLGKIVNDNPHPDLFIQNQISGLNPIASYGAAAKQIKSILYTDQ